VRPEKGYSAIFLIVGVLIVAILGGSIYYANNFMNPKIQPQSSTKLQTSLPVAASHSSASPLAPVYVGDYEVAVKVSSDSPCNNDIYLATAKAIFI
jgi:hypothetical protein